MATGSNRNPVFTNASIRIGLTSNSYWRPTFENGSGACGSTTGVEFFIHPAMPATPEMGFPEFFRQDRDGQPRGVIQVIKAEKS